jgi:twinkle protein
MDAHAIKTALNERVEDFARWLFSAGQKNGNEWLVGSLAGESGKSLSIRIAGSKLGVWSDFATGETGSNLLELYIQSRQVDCGQAIKECVEWLGSPVGQLDNNVFVPGGTAHKSQAPKILPSEIYSPTYDECQQVMAMIERMRDDAALRERCATQRGWNPETLRQLALEGYLGWHHGKIAFIYDTGVKLRWREAGERIIRWAFGKPWLWRGAYLSIPTRINVYITEGESDCIALLDGGLEDDKTRLAVAVPSSSTFDSSWTQLFTGKHIVLCFDADDAGQKAVARVSSVLQRHAGSISRLNWEGLRHAC